MIQHIPWEKITFTGRVFSVENRPVTLFLLAQCVVCMALDICFYFAGAIFSYRILAWTLFTPTENGFYCGDESIREPFYANTIPTLHLLAITLAAPFFVILFTDILTKVIQRHSEEFAKVINHSTYVYLDYVTAFWIMTLAIDILKCSVGRLRPNFIVMCSPIELDEICTRDPTAYVPVAHCTSGWKTARNSKLSFPSGHAAASIFCTLFLFYYLRGMQRVFPFLRMKILFFAVSFANFMFTSFCCYSRIADCWHFPTDVLGGVILGFIVFHVLLHKYRHTPTVRLRIVKK